jgi:hypothetical protein
MKKRYPPEVMNGLSYALSKIFWYKKDLKNYLIRLGIPKNVVLNLNWDNYKIEVVEDLIIGCEEMGDKGLGYLRSLIKEVSEFDSFTHLLRLDDGPKKTEEAKEAVKSLRALVGKHDSKIEEERKQAEARRVYFEEKGTQKAFVTKLAELNSEFQRITGLPEQERGYELEILLYRIFDLFDLNPRDSFKRKGDQIDGAFTLGTDELLLEARWRKEGARLDAINVFTKKVDKSLRNTLGLFLSIEGFSDDSIEHLALQENVPLILMDGMDLLAVLEGRLDLVELLNRKKRHANDTGNVYLRVNDILSGRY